MLVVPKEDTLLAFLWNARFGQDIHIPIQRGSIRTFLLALRTAVPSSDESPAITMATHAGTKKKNAVHPVFALRVYRWSEWRR